MSMIASPLRPVRQMMSNHRVPYVIAFAIVAVGATAVTLGVSQSSGGSTAGSASSALFNTPHILYRSLEEGPNFTNLAYVPVDDPTGDGAAAGPKCLRVAAAADYAVCMRNGTNPAVPFEVEVLNEKLEAESDQSLAGVPSRARVAPDGQHYATTVFVSGHNYISLGFSTETIIYEKDGTSLGNLEEYAFMLNNERREDEDRNIWGVTFAEDSNRFFATMATGGRTYLVQGDIDERTLTAIHENAECPSLSPDGRTVVYKKSVGGGQHAWRFYAFDLETGKETQLGETRSIDDQVAWLDNENIIYGVTKSGGGATAADIWMAPLDGGQPELLIENADSPTIVGR